MRETRVRRIGRATIGSAVVFGASLALWLSQRPEEKLQQTPETIPWPAVSWVIVTTTSTTTTTLPESTTTKPKRTTTTAVETTTIPESSTSVDPAATTTAVEGSDSTPPGTSTTSTTVPAG
ncbi:MAG: hypothetical protein RLZZ199_996 [Actinomycetota bacterium]|jgi:uncharacterized membrane protein YadS